MLLCVLQQKQWKLLEKRFNHYFELKSREPQWGRMEMSAPDKYDLHHFAAGHGISLHLIDHVVASCSTLASVVKPF